MTTTPGYRFPENLLLRLRFCPPTTLPTGCVEFTGALDSLGYARVIKDSRSQMVHRLAYELCVGPIPDGLTIDHLCRNRACVNPGHLEPVTHRENVLRSNNPAAINARKTHCKHGHEFTEENTLVSKNGRNRQCRKCAKARSVAFRKARRDAAA